MTTEPTAQIDAGVLPDTPDRMLTPIALWKRYGLPRDLIYDAIHDQDLPAYNAARSGKPRFLVAVSDFLTWRETLRVGAK